MTCRKAPRNPTAVRDVIAGLFRRGKGAAAARQRLAQCCHGSECGRLCENLVKAPGVQAWCVNLATGEKVDLYPALEREDFHCPEGRF